MQSGYFTQLREIEEEVGSFGSLAPPIATRKTLRAVTYMVPFYFIQSSVLYFRILLQVR